MRAEVRLHRNSVVPLQACLGNRDFEERVVASTRSDGAPEGMRSQSKRDEHVPEHGRLDDVEKLLAGVDRVRSGDEVQYSERKR